MIPPPAPSGRIPSLDGLRALSIALVVVDHAAKTLPWDGPALRAFTLVFGNGHLGVAVFFTISGYLITRLLRQERERTGGIDLPAFYARRTIRIFPAFYAYIAVVAALTGADVLDVAWPDTAAAATYLWNYKHVALSDLSRDGWWFLGHTWSLSLEEQFYLLWPFAVVALGVLGARRAAIAVVVLAPLSRVVTYALWPEGRGYIGMMLHTAADGILVGAVVALVEGEPWFERAVGWLRSGLVPALAFGLAFVVSPLLAARFGGAYALPVGMTLESVCVTVLLVWAVRYPATRVGRVLNSRPLAAVGVLSYSLYLWQQLFLAPYETPLTLAFPLNVVAAIAAATASYWLVEKPFMRLRGRLRRREPMPAPI